MDEQEVLRHKRVLEDIKKAKKMDELPKASLSSITSYLANMVYFDNRHLSRSLFNPIAKKIISSGGMLNPSIKEDFIKLLRDNYPGKDESLYTNKYYMVAYNPKISNILIEIGERNSKIMQFKDVEDLDNHNKIMKKINNSFDLKDLPWVGNFSRVILSDFNNNDYINSFKVSDIKDFCDAYMNESSFKEIEYMVHEFCYKQFLTNEEKRLMFNQIVSNLVTDKRIRYKIIEYKTLAKRRLEIYRLNHEEVMENIENATRISQLPPNLTESRLTSYLSGNSIIIPKGKKISNSELKNLTRMLLLGKKWEDDVVREELARLSSNYYNNISSIDNIDDSVVTVSSDLLYEKFSKLPKTYYLVDEINACNKKVKEFTKNSTSNVNVYFIPNSKGPIDGGRFYNCYINRIDNLDLGRILPLNLDDIVSPSMDIDSIEWYIQEKYDKTFKKAGGIILNKDETIGNVNIFSPNDIITEKERVSYDKLSLLYEEACNLFKRWNIEQDNYLKSKSVIEQELFEIKNKIDELNSEVKGYSRKRIKDDE